MSTERAKAIVEKMFRNRPVSAFLTEAYTESAVSLPGAVDPASILSLEEIESLLHLPAFCERVPVLIREPGQNQTSRAHSGQEAIDAIAKGHSVHLVEIQNFLPDTHPVMMLYRALEVVLGTSGRGITGFLASQGESVPIHHDFYEVFALQLEGRKTWSLYGFTRPDMRDDAYDEPELDQAVTLGPGDMLYMPKSQIHHVVTNEGPSLSLSLAFEAESWLYLLDAIGAELRHSRDFWRSIPGHGIADGVEARRAAIIEAVKTVDAEDFAKRLQESRADEIPGLPDPQLRSRFPNNPKE